MGKLLADKVILVTGAGNGIGRAHALACAREGAHVVVNDLGGARDGTGADQGAAAKVVAEIEAMGGQAVANTDSVTDPEGCARMVEAALGRWGHLDAVVNNAGILRDKTFLKLTEDEWDLVVAVHLRGTMNVCRAAIPALSKQGGSIVNTTSYSGMIGNFGQSNYAAAKAGVYGLTRVLSMELRKAKIRANCLAPIAKTRMTEDIAMVEAEWTPEQIAPMVVFLCSDLAAAVTGQVFGVQGQRIHLYEVKTNDGVEKPGASPWTAEEIAARLGDISAWEKAAPAKATDSGASAAIRQAFSFAPAAFRAERAGDFKTRIHFAIKDDPGQTLVVENGAARVEDGLTGSPECTVKTDAETIIGIFQQTIDPQKAFMKGRITADNMGVLMKFAMYFDFSAGKPAAAAPTAAATAPAANGPKQYPIGKTYEGGAVFAKPLDAEAYAAATDDPNGPYAGTDAICPPMFHVRLFKDLLFQVATDPELELDLLRLLHGEHHAVFHHPIRPWDLVQLRARLHAVEEKSSGLLVTSKVYGIVDGRTAVEVTTAYFIRGSKRGEKSAAPAAEAVPVAPTFTTAVAVSADQSLRYASASLDDNPIHTDAATAAAAGLPGVILQGLCTMAMSGAALVAGPGGGDSRRLKSLGVRFARPVLNGATLQLRAWDGGGGAWSFDVLDDDGRTVISNGHAELRP
jgi:NAD(P)-dependent dehydrogenase (short-subunit alcohol dehydrogenase family)/acyl dehydratase/putative sterol carrier protein